MERLYLSERNVRALLSKVERFKAGELTQCTIIKCHNPSDPFPSSIKEVAITIIPDREFYANRAPGVMHPKEEEALRKG